MDDTDLMTIHGDSWQSPVWAVLGPDGSTFSLNGWAIRSQLRRTVGSSTVVHEWTRTHGVLVKSVVVEKLDGTTVTTSGVQLVLSPMDYADLPPSFSGMLDIEISNDNSVNPAERHTIVPPRAFYIRPDVTRG